MNSTLHCLSILLVLLDLLQLPEIPGRTNNLTNARGAACGVVASSNWLIALVAGLTTYLLHTFYRYNTVLVMNQYLSVDRDFQATMMIAGEERGTNNHPFLSAMLGHGVINSRNSSCFKKQELFQQATPLARLVASS